MINKLIKSFFIIILFFCFCNCNEDRVKPAKVDINENNLPDNEIFNGRIVFSDSGKTKAILQAGVIKVFTQRNETLLENGIKIDFFDKDEKHISVLTAKRGKSDNLTNDLYAYENVIAKSDSNVVLKTEELVWRERIKKITTDKFVEIDSPKEIIKGTGFESDPDLKNYTIYKVSGTIER